MLDISELLDSVGGEYQGKGERIFSLLFKHSFPSCLTFQIKSCAEFSKVEEFLNKNFETLEIWGEDFKTIRSTYIDKKNKLVFYHDHFYALQIFYNLNDKKSKSAAEKMVKELIDNKLVFDDQVKDDDTGVSVLIKDDQYGLKYKKTRIESSKVDIDLNYTDDFKPKYEVIKKFLISSEKGLIIMSGKFGTGKSHFLRHLISELGNRVNFVYIAPTLLNNLSGPDFLSFLIGQKQDKNTVFIIEDAENVIKSREINENSSSSVSNLLNLADGLLGDILKIKVIATINSELTKIDEALLRKGRLKVEHKFTALPVDKTNNLLKRLGKNYISEKELTLAEIYNLDKENFREKDKEKQIGFANLIKK